MRAAITQRIIVVGSHKTTYDALDHAYTTFFGTQGIALLPVANGMPHRESWRSQLPIEGLILTGGDDLDPKQYGTSREDGKVYTPERDATEWQLMKYMIENRKPIFGICRGMQCINVFFGGKLIQNIETEIPNQIGHRGTTHAVTVIDDQMAKRFGKKSFITNSYHRQGVTSKTLSPKLRAFASTTDGIIEGLYHPEFPIIGVQWHPERLNAPKEIDQKLITAFKRGSFFDL